MTDTPTITQSDREAAADLAAQFQRYTLVQIEAPAIRRGEHDDWELVKAFAAHRNAALSPPEADIVERGWQPIETAPKGDADTGPFFDVCWAGRAHSYLPVPLRQIDCYREGGAIKREHGYPSVTTIFNPSPTHWMPRPAPPAIRSTSIDRTGV